jgi:acetyl-CoA C-acetyltransferase
MKSEARVAGDGLLAAYYASMQILAGAFDTTLVVAHCKGSEGAHYALTNWTFDPIYQQTLGLDYLSAAALQARCYMHRYGISPTQCARVVVKNRRNARHNTAAQAPAELTVEDVLNSPLLADPIHELEAAPVSDGACAVILASEETARSLSSRPVWIRGVGSSVDAHYLGDRDLADCEALTVAAQKAYRMAGVTDPRREIDVAEISEAFSYQELLWTEGLGLCPRGHGGRLVEEGITASDGALPVNPSGGMLSGNPFFVAGLTRVVEAVLQVRGQAGERQIRNVRTALAHGTQGPCGQAHAVMIVGA